MLYNTSVSIAFKDYDGQYKIVNSSIFELESINYNFTSLNIKMDKNRGIIFMIKCPICGCKHYYSYNLSDIMRHDLIFGGCETMGVPLFFIGKKNKVEQTVRKYCERNRKIIAMI